MEPRLEVRHLRLLLAIAQEGGVTKAGRRLHLTQSALSHQLRDAEARLGTPLFLRLKRRMVLTPAGECLLASAERLLADLQRAEDEVRSLAGGTVGSIRLSTECYTVYHWLPVVLKAFHKRFPRVEIAIDVDATRHTVAALLEGKLDLGIVSSEPEDRRLRLTHLFEDELVAILARQHPLAARPYLRPRDFAGETLFVYPPREDSLVVRRVLAPAGVTPRIVTPLLLTEAIQEMVKAGLGIAVLARWAVGPQLAAGALVARKVTSAGLHRRWDAATLAATPLTPCLAEFIALIGERAFPVSRGATA